MSRLLFAVLALGCLAAAEDPTIETGAVYADNEELRSYLYEAAANHPALQAR